MNFLRPDYLNMYGEICALTGKHVILNSCWPQFGDQIDREWRGDLPRLTRSKRSKKLTILFWSSPHRGVKRPEPCQHYAADKISIAFDISAQAAQQFSSIILAILVSRTVYGYSALIIPRASVLMFVFTLFSVRRPAKDHWEKHCNRRDTFILLGMRLPRHETC